LVVEAAREKALALARPRAADPGLAYLVGELELELTTARLAWAELVALAADSTPGVETTNRITAARTLLGRAAIRTVEKAMEVAGGTAFYREHGLERLFRDVQGARYHPLQEKVQLRMSGRLALGLDIDEYERRRTVVSMDRKPLGATEASCSLSAVALRPCTAASDPVSHAAAYYYRVIS
jgi:acyl-CoA dehydrogenase